MKCKYCGGDVTLNDRYCPHCGRPVEQAERHQSEMRQYEAEFEETKREAMNKIAASGGGTAVGIRLAVITALIAALIWMLFNLNSYSMHERTERREARKNYDAYVEQIDQYIKDRDYAALSVFSDQHMLNTNGSFRAYREIIYAADAYTSVYKGILETAYATKETRSMYYAEEMSKNLNRFYEQILNTSYTESAPDPDRTQKVYDEMEEDLVILLKAYIDLSDEEAASLRDLSKSKRTVLIEQALDKKIVGLTGRGLSQMKKTELPQVGETAGEGE